MSEEQEYLDTEAEQGEDLYLHYSFTVDKRQTPIRIDKFLMDKMQQVTRNKLQNGIRAGSVLVDGKAIKPNYKIKPQELIEIVLPQAPTDAYKVEPEEMDLNIVYEDADVMVINKPAGLVVHPGLGNKSGTLVNGLAHYFQHVLPIKAGNNNDRPGLVHRIDKDTRNAQSIFA